MSELHSWVAASAGVTLCSKALQTSQRQLATMSLQVGPLRGCVGGSSLFGCPYCCARSTQPNSVALQEMLQRAMTEVEHLKHRRKLDKKVMRKHQSKAFFLEETAEAHQSGEQTSALQVRRSLQTCQARC